MKIKHSVTTFSVAVVALLFASATLAQQKQSEAKPLSPFSSTELAERTIRRRAVEAVIWGMPLVNTDAMRQAYLRDVGAKYNDICYFSKPAEWRFQVTGHAGPIHAAEMM
jgi:hypothetical protein